jgi:hypothetical protein
LNSDLRDVGSLDAQLDEVKIALGEVRSRKKLSEMEWAEYWRALQKVSDCDGGTRRLPGRPRGFSGDQLEPLPDPALPGTTPRSLASSIWRGGLYRSIATEVEWILVRLDRQIW